MSLHTGVHSIHHGFRALAILFLALVGLAGSTWAQEPAAREKIYVVTHVDVVPTMVLVDQDGTILWRHKGQLSPRSLSELDRLIQRRLNPQYN